MYVHSLSRTLLQKSQFENVTFSQMTFRDISCMNRTFPFSAQKALLEDGFSQVKIRKDAYLVSYMYFVKKRV